MRYIIVFFISFFIACSVNMQKQPNYIEGTSKRWGTDEFQEIRYFKDVRTNLCFAERGSSNDYSFTCVPCDSLEKINILKSNKYIIVPNEENSKEKEK